MVGIDEEVQCEIELFVDIILNHIAAYIEQKHDISRELASVRTPSLELAWACDGY